MPRTKQPASACSKVNTAQDRKVTNALMLGSRLFYHRFSLRWLLARFQERMTCMMSRQKIWKIRFAAQSNFMTIISLNGKEHSIPSVQVDVGISSLYKSEVTWARRRTDVFFFFKHKPKGFLNINSPFFPPALKASRDAMMPTTWCQRPWWRPTAQCGTRLSLSQANRWSRCSPASSWCVRSRRSSTLVQRTRAAWLDSWHVYLKTMQYPYCLSVPKQMEFYNTTVIISHWVYDNIFSWLFFPSPCNEMFFLPTFASAALKPPVWGLRLTADGLLLYSAHQRW